MNFDAINKKRKIICATSLILTILIVLLYVASFLIFGSRSYLVPIIGLFVMIALLYLLSKCIVYKYYLNLKASIVNLALKKDLKVKSIVTYKEDLSFINHFYNSKNVNVKSNFRFIFDNLCLDTIEFEVTTNRNFKSNKVIRAGKYIKFDVKSDINDVVFIKNFDEETEKYVNYFKVLFNKKDDNYYVDNKRRYVCLYNEKVDSSLISVFDKLNVFHVLYVKDNVAHILFIDNTPIFDFKLTNHVDNSTVNACSQCFNKLIKLINSIRKVVE